MSYKAKFFLFTALIFIFLIFLLTIVCYGAVERRPRFDIDGSIGDDFIGQASILYPLRNSEDSIFYSDLRYRVGSDEDYPILQWQD